MNFILSINTDNAAFDDENINTELVKCLRDLAARVELHSTLIPEQVFTVFDSNGNKVGTAKLEE